MVFNFIFCLWLKLRFIHTIVVVVIIIIIIIIAVKFGLPDSRMEPLQLTACLSCPCPAGIVPPTLYCISLNGQCKLRVSSRSFGNLFITFEAW